MKNQSQPVENTTKEEHSQDVRPTPFQRWKRRMIYFILFGIFLYVFMCWGPLEWILYSALYYETPMQKADVVLVGGAGYSLDTAVELYQQGTVRAIVIIEGIPKQYQGVKELVSINHLICADLKKTGIPDEDVFSFPQKAHNLLDVQRMLREIMLKQHFESYICYPPDYASRFTKIMHDDTFIDTSVKAIIRPTSGPRIWRKQMLAIQNTFIRLGFWVIVYAPQLRAEIEEDNQILKRTDEISKNL